jgi:nitrogen fixation/metabolism regulation signal transduction histidine kinase
VDVIRNLVNEFSRFTKLPEIKMETHNLNNILKEIIPSFKNIKKDINFITNLDNNLPNVNIDKKQIYQVVTNIINNSIQSFEKSERKTEKVEIKTKYIKYRKVVLLQIRDNGCGIDDTIKEKIFEPYFSTKSYGTGIGLTIVKSIIDSHNGKISVKDNKPYGTTIEIEFTIT